MSSTYVSPLPLCHVLHLLSLRSGSSGRLSKISKSADGSYKPLRDQQHSFYRRSVGNILQGNLWTTRLCNLWQTCAGSSRRYNIGCQLVTNDCHRLLDEISEFVQKEPLCGFLKLLFTKDQRIAQIDAYHRRIAISVASFEVS
jgi:hypothetical protein